MGHFGPFGYNPGKTPNLPIILRPILGILRVPFIQDPSGHAPKSQNGPNRFLPVRDEVVTKTEEAFSLFEFGVLG